jgi:hypothetical protein
MEPVFPCLLMEAKLFGFALTSVLWYRPVPGQGNQRRQEGSGDAVFRAVPSDKSVMTQRIGHLLTSEDLAGSARKKGWTAQEIVT